MRLNLRKNLLKNGNIFIMTVILIEVIMMNENILTGNKKSASTEKRDLYMLKKIKQKRVRKAILNENKNYFKLYVIDYTNDSM